MAIQASAAASRGTTSLAVRPRKLEGDDVDPRWPRLRRPLLVEELPGDAVGVADQNVGPPDREQRALRNGQVVAHQIELGVARSGKEHLARVGDRDLPPADDEKLSLAFARHPFAYRPSWPGASPLRRGQVERHVGDAVLISDPQDDRSR